MPEKKVLLQNEFAIQKAAIFNLIENESEIIVNDDGTMSITLSYKLADPAADLQNTEGDIVFNFCGVFDSTLDNNFKQGTDLVLTIDASDQIKLTPINKDLITTRAVKGRQGDTFTNIKRKR